MAATQRRLPHAQRRRRADRPDFDAVALPAPIRPAQDDPALNQGDYEAIDGAPDGCFAYLRQKDSQRMAVLLNMTSSRLRVNLPDIGIGAVAVSTHLDRSGPVSLTDIELRADEGVVIELSTGTT